MWGQRTIRRADHKHTAVTDMTRQLMDNRRRTTLSTATFAGCLLVFGTQTLTPPVAAQDYQDARHEMVRDQIERRKVTSPAVLRAMRSVPRHEFVPTQLRSQAYADHPVPIGYGQTISQPFIVAFMTEAVRPRRKDRVLEVGTGSGYQAAVLAEIVDTVYTIEIVPQLAESAEDRLSRLQYKNVMVRHGDGYHGWAEVAPFDVIVVTAAAEHVPPPLIEQLKDGGRMIIPVGTPFIMQYLILLEKSNGEVKTTSLLPVRFVPFRRAKE